MALMALIMINESYRDLIRNRLTVAFKQPASRCIQQSRNQTQKGISITDFCRKDTSVKDSK